MRNVAFHLHNVGIDKIDCRNIINSNPGIGGTEYAILCIAHHLSMRDNDLNVTLFCKKKGVFPKEINFQVINTVEHAIINSINNKIDYFVVDYKRLPNELISKYPNLKFVIWAHNFINENDLNFYSNTSNVIRVINVGREQRDLHRDHKVAFKLDYIFNGMSISTIDSYNVSTFPFKKRGNNVIYMGSIVPSKGFHILAKAWPKILKSVPDAKLYVLGSGKLYNRNLELGKLGIAEKKYEEKFVNYLSNDGEIHSSVRFMGVLGKEKNDILLKCRVGVPNPSGSSETFGFTAIEMQAMGCNVTTIKCPGYLDTVLNKKNLYKSTNSLASQVVKLLKAPSNELRDKYNFIDSNFSFKVIIPQWEELFNKSLNEKYLLHPYNEVYNTEFRLKFMKEFLRKMKAKYSLLQNITTIEFILTRTIDKLKNKWLKINN